MAFGMLLVIMYELLRALGNPKTVPFSGPLFSQILLCITPLDCLVQVRHQGGSLELYGRDP